MAAAHNIAQGTGADAFDPDGVVTREQMAAILYRYAKEYDCDTNTDTAPAIDLRGYRDGDTVSAWAKEAMTWSVEKRLISGKGGGVLDPKGIASRAEVAVVFQRLCALVVLDPLSLSSLS